MDVGMRVCACHDRGMFAGRIVALNCLNSKPRFRCQLNFISFIGSIDDKRSFVSCLAIRHRFSTFGSTDG